MASQKQNPLRVIGGQIQSILPISNPGSHKPMQDAKVIDSFESVPAVYREFFQPYLSRGEAFPYTVITPTYDLPGGTIGEKLLSVIEHSFYVLEEQDGRLTRVCYPIDEINSVEVIHWPSDLQVRINGATNLGRPSTSVFGCSRSTSQVFAPLFQRIRLRIVSLNEKAPSRHMERLDRWKDLDTRVIEMARHCLMAGETVIEAILQPEIRAGLFSPERVLRGAKCPTHICILTDKELVLIREDPSQGKPEQGGSICNFIPLNKIHSLAVTKEHENLLTVAIRVGNGEVFESLFDVSLEQEVHRFLEKTRERLPREKIYVRDTLGST